LHVLPVHHATGIGIMFFPFLISGSLMDFRSGNFDPAWMWDRWRRGGLTFFSGVPTMYMRLKWHFEQNLARLPGEHLEQYIAGARQFRAMLCGTSALPGPIAQFWTDIRGGKGILTRYGATEFGAPFKVPLDAERTPEDSVGEIVPGVEVKLSEGDKGEVLVKSPQMFSRYAYPLQRETSSLKQANARFSSRYLFDDDATAKAHDSEGFFKTGNIARREGHHYFILGRASLDIIKTGGYKISALDIERECLALPYVEEVMVVGVEDEELGSALLRSSAFVKTRIPLCSGKGPGEDNNHRGLEERAWD
jgi:malonyl-CoA/methylmalonyl-CoA synthetase